MGDEFSWAKVVEGSNKVYEAKLINSAAREAKGRVDKFCNIVLSGLKFPEGDFSKVNLVKLEDTSRLD